MLKNASLIFLSRGFMSDCSPAYASLLYYSTLLKKVLNAKIKKTVKTIYITVSVSK